MEFIRDCPQVSVVNGAAVGKFVGVVGVSVGYDVNVGDNVGYDVNVGDNVGVKVGEIGDEVGDRIVVGDQVSPLNMSASLWYP